MSTLEPNSGLAVASPVDGLLLDHLQASGNESHLDRRHESLWEADCRLWRLVIPMCYLDFL